MLDGAADETVPETDEVTEPTESIEELPFDEAETAPEVKKTPPKTDTKTEANKKRSKRYVKGAQKKEEPREQEDTFRL